MKKMFFQFIFVYVFSLIAAVLLLIFKSRILEYYYLVARISLFEYSVLTGMLLFIPRFTMGILKKIFKKNNVINPDKYPEGSIYWSCIVLFVFILDVFFGITLVIPIAAIIQSSYVLYRFAKIYKIVILMDLEE